MKKAILGLLVMTGSLNLFAEGVGIPYALSCTQATENAVKMYVHGSYNENNEFELSRSIIKNGRPVGAARTMQINDFVRKGKIAKYIGVFDTVFAGSGIHGFEFEVDKTDAENIVAVLTESISTFNEATGKRISKSSQTAFECVEAQ